ncbi:PD-(D/E)XK nuclease-like domain-containing protein [Nocardia tengchongensis]
MSNDICSVSDLDREICPHCRPAQPEAAAPTEPGLYADIPEPIYHGDKTSLSSSGIRELLKPGGPAHFQDKLKRGSAPQPHFDEGHAAHAEVLGTGLEVVEIQAKDWKSKAAQEARDRAHRAGQVPLLTHQVEMVRAMGDVVRANPTAMALLSGGRPEVSGYAIDPQTWVRLRSRTDYLIEHGNGLVTVVDYKTTTDASPRGFAASAEKYGYVIQEAVYRRVLAALGFEVDVFKFIAQEKTPPYLISFHENAIDDVALADVLVSRAIEIYAQCTATNEWPGYGDETNIIRMSRWARYDAEEALL